MATRGLLSSEDGHQALRPLEFSVGLYRCLSKCNGSMYKGATRVCACSSIFLKNHRWKSASFICCLRDFLSDSAF